MNEVFHHQWGIITQGNPKVVHVPVPITDIRLSVGIVARRRMDGQTDSVFDQKDVIDVRREESHKAD